MTNDLSPNFSPTFHYSKRNSIFFHIFLQLSANNYKIHSSPNGEVSERLKEHAWKACVLETVPWVRIPPSPVRLYFMGNRINNIARDNANNEWSGSPAMKNCELCQDRKAAAISRPLYVFGISRASFFLDKEIKSDPCTWH